MQTITGFRILFITELAYKQLKARAGILIYRNEEVKGKDLIIVSGIHEQFSKHLLTKSVDVTFQYFGSNICSHWVESVWKYNTHHIAKLSQ